MKRIDVVIKHLNMFLLGSWDGGMYDTSLRPQPFLQLPLVQIFVRMATFSVVYFPSGFC